jgi:hypothetical protein
MQRPRAWDPTLVTLPLSWSLVCSLLMLLLFIVSFFVCFCYAILSFFVSIFFHSFLVSSSHHFFLALFPSLELRSSPQHNGRLTQHPCVMRAAVVPLSFPPPCIYGVSAFSSLASYAVLSFSVPKVLTLLIWRPSLAKKSVLPLGWRMETHKLVPHVPSTHMASYLGTLWPPH